MYKAYIKKLGNTVRRCAFMALYIYKKGMHIDFKVEDTSGIPKISKHICKSSLKQVSDSLNYYKLFLNEILA